MNMVLENSSPNRWIRLGLPVCLVGGVGVWLEVMAAWSCGIDWHVAHDGEVQTVISSEQVPMGFTLQSIPGIFHCPVKATSL
jgi:hypothetical protein